MNAQVIFKLGIFNLESDSSAEALGKQIEQEIEPIIQKIIKATAKNRSWIYELETRLKENIPVSENAKQIFEANNISIEEEE